MTKTEMDIRSVLGVTNQNIQPFVMAVDLFAQRMFSEHIPIDDIQLSKDIYPAVAKALRYNKSGTVARQIERLANVCWDYGDRERLCQIAGKALRFPPSVRELFVYFAYYSYTGTAFFQAVDREPALLL